MRRLLDAFLDFLSRRGEHYIPMLLNGSIWIGLAFSIAAGLTIDKWIDLRNQAKEAEIEFHLDWLDWSKGIFAVSAACFTTWRNFRDGSYVRYRDNRKQSETEFLRRQANGNSKA